MSRVTASLVSVSVMKNSLNLYKREQLSRKEAASKIADPDRMSISFRKSQPFRKFRVSLDATDIL